MSDNLRRYCAILVALKQHYPTEPTGNLARHLATLAALICGIVGSRKTNLPRPFGVRGVFLRRSPGAGNGGSILVRCLL